MRPTSAWPLKLLGVLFLFLLGLVVGALLLTPWSRVWTLALAKADRFVSKADVSWKSLTDAGPLGFTLEDVRFADSKGGTIARIRNAKVRIGLLPLSVDMELDTGRPLRGTVYRSGRLVIRGEVDLENLLSRRDIRGVVRLDGDISTPQWKSAPESGRLEVHTQAVELPGEIRAQGVSALVELSGDNLSLRSFSSVGPVPVKGSGVLHLNWGNLRASTYDISGQISFNNRPTPFNYKGDLGRIAWLPL